MSEAIGEMLKKARESRKLRQEDMALKLGISARQYQKYEEGKFPKFKGEAIKKLDAILGTNAHELLYEQDVQQPDTKKPAPEGEGLKDKYIDALERLVEKQESLLTSVQSKLTEVEQTLTEIKHNQRIAYSFQLAFQEYWVEHFQTESGNLAAAEAKIGRIAFSHLQKIPEEGTLL